MSHLKLPSRVKNLEQNQNIKINPNSSAPLSSSVPINVSPSSSIPPSSSVPNLTTLNMSFKGKRGKNHSDKLIASDLNIQGQNINVQNPSKEQTPMIEHVSSTERGQRRSENKTKIGTYATTEFQNWLNTPIQKPKIKRSKKTNDDAYQIFQDFSNLVENEEWKLFFQKLYTGKFPHGYSYRNQTLFFRKRTKIEKLDIQDSSITTLNKVMNFFQNYGGFTIIDDNLNIFDYLVSKSETYHHWKDIRSKKTKQFFIQKFADEMALKYNLRLEKKRELLDTIHTGFLLRCIDTTDIVFDERKIIEIKTLKWIEEKNDFELIMETKNNKNSRKSFSEKQNRNSFASHWSRFLSHVVRDRNVQDDISTDVSLNVEDLTDTTSVSLSIVTDNDNI